MLTNMAPKRIFSGPCSHPRTIIVVAPSSTNLSKRNNFIVIALAAKRDFGTDFWEELCLREL
jgi:hypothetical protein